MNRYVTKTSKQARQERLIENKDSFCPECDRPAIGIRVVREGFFTRGEMSEYTCFDCGCEWNTGWK